MNLILKKYQYHIFLILIGLLWISLFDFLTQMSLQGVMHSDSFNYQESAENLFIFHRGHIYRPILMAVITGIPYLFGGSDGTVFSFSFYVNILCWLATSLVLFKILKEFIRPKYAFVFTVSFFFILGNTAHVFHLLTETIYVFFIALAFYFLMRYLKQQQFLMLSLSLSIIVLSMLIKPGSKFLAIIFVGYFIRVFIKNYQSKFIWFFYGSIFLVFVQCAGMKYQFGNFTISYIDSVTYYAYVGSKARCFESDKEYSQANNPRADYLFSNEASNQKRIAEEDFKQQLRFNTLNLFKAYISDVVENTKSGNSCIDECKNLTNRNNFSFWKGLLFSVTKWQNRIFTLLAVLLSVYFLVNNYKTERIYFYIAFFITYIIILSGISCGQGDRFHLVTFPFMIVLLAKFLSQKTKLFREG